MNGKWLLKQFRKRIVKIEKIQSKFKAKIDELRAYPDKTKVEAEAIATFEESYGTLEKIKTLFKTSMDCVSLLHSNSNEGMKERMDMIAKDLAECISNASSVSSDENLEDVSIVSKSYSDECIINQIINI